MPTKKPTVGEQRQALQRQLDEMDLARLKAVAAIYERPEVAQALADLKALADETDTEARLRSAGGDTNALVAHAIIGWTNPGVIASQLAQALDAKLNPPAPAADPADASAPIAPAD